jgi:multisubunit Na+/H+ antiporter MnhG subunit
MIPAAPSQALSHERELHRAMVADFKRAKDHQRLVFGFSYLSTGLAALSAFDLPRWLAMTLLVVIIVCLITSRILTYKGRAAYSRGQARHREHRRLDALHQLPSVRTVLELPGASEHLDLGAVAEDRVYYNTDAPAGRARLLDSLTQSALQTELIAAKAAHESCSLFFGIWILTTLVIIILAPLSNQAFTFQSYQAVLLLLTGLTLGPHLDAWIAYTGLHNTAKECANRFIDLRTAPLVPDELDRWMATYDCALAAAPVLPDRLWKKTEQTANEKWRRILTGQ